MTGGPGPGPATPTWRDDELATATEHGRVCALAVAGERDLAACVGRHPELFPARPFDPAVLSGVALATAFGAPWCDAEGLRVANRAALWVFAADWRIDTLATDPTQVTDLLTGCLAVADGAPPAADDPLGRFLGEIRDALFPAGAPATHRAAWREEFRRMLTAMVREWRWKTTATTPTVEAYLDNADNFGSSFVNVSHWIHLGDPAALAHLTALTAAGRSVQRVLRLVNDLATHHRDVGWGDLNALMLGLDRAGVRRRIDDLVVTTRELVDRIAPSCPTEARYLTRQIGFSTGFYRIGDFWGSR